MRGPAVAVIWSILVVCTFPATAGQTPQSAESQDQPPFCGPKDEPLVVATRSPGDVPAIVPEGKARIHMVWRASPIKQWSKKTQCKVALNGTWVAALEKNTRAFVDVDPGKLRFCAASTWMDTTRFHVRGVLRNLSPTWRSLMFLNTTAGEQHYLLCSPGGDNWGASQPTLDEVEQKEGEKAIGKRRLVTLGREQP